MTSAQIVVRLQPRARRNELVGLREGVLVARVSAPPVDGRANRALRQMIAKRAGVAPSRVTIVRGDHARDKLVRVEGIDADELRSALDLPPIPPD